MPCLSRVLMTLALIVTPVLAAGPSQAAPIGTDAFKRVWQRTDQPISNLKTARTWMWGPEANTGILTEPYTDASDGQRTVQYFDKSRMEINAPNRDPESLWYVTNGLLTKELITGKLQTGDSSFERYQPAKINASGDPNDPNAPTYATFHHLLGDEPVPTGHHVVQTVDRKGSVGADPSLVAYGVTASAAVPETRHTVASVFWDMMNSTGLVYENGEYLEERLFQNPFYATGYPLTEAYWTTVLVGGVPKRVLIQVFERRVLTFTPDNPDGWKVEAGNVGRHYHEWRYNRLTTSPSPPTSQFNVTYRITGYAEHGVLVTYTTAEGGSSQNGLPYLNSNNGYDWHDSGTFLASETAEVSALVQPYQVYDQQTNTWRTLPGYGSLTCQILLNGEVWRTSTASGEKAGVVCKGIVGQN